MEEAVAVGTQNSFAAELAVKLGVAAATGTSGQVTAGEYYLLSCLSCVSHINVFFFVALLLEYSETSFAC